MLALPKPYLAKPSVAFAAAFLATALLFVPLIVKAEEPLAAIKAVEPEDDHAIVSLVLENDIAGGTDSNYTNGFRLSTISSEETSPRTLRWLADHALPISSEGKKRISFAVGQSIYTPRLTQLNPPDPNDRPYAGWLYSTIGVVSDRGDRLDNIALTVGVVGESALGEQVQNGVHRLIGDQEARGWDSQLHDEPGVMFSMERKWRSLYKMDAAGLQADVSPSIGGNLGNVMTDASVGAMARLGFDLPADYGPPRIRPSIPGSDFFVPSETLGGYLFAGVDGRAVARNIFLDGNTFRDSPSVDKKYFVGSIQGGVAVVYENTRIAYTHVLMSKEFDGQERPEQYGALSLSYRF